MAATAKNAKKTTKPAPAAKPAGAKKPAMSADPTFSEGADPLAAAPVSVVSLPTLLGAVETKLPDDVNAIAERLLSDYRPRLFAIPPERVDTPRVDLNAVGLALLNVHALADAPPLKSLYAAAAERGEFNIENLDHLKNLGFILLHAYRLAEAEGAFNTEAKIPAAIDKESAQVESRIQRVCEHYFLDDSVIGPTLRRLSSGTGYLDRAYDLLGYADIYETKKAIVSQDPVHYRPTDLADARRLASQILAALGGAMNPSARDAYDLLVRAWTFTRPVYFEVQELGLRFLRYDPKRDERFPSLFVVGRAGGGRRKQKKDEPAPAP